MSGGMGDIVWSEWQSQYKEDSRLSFHDAIPAYLQEHPNAFKHWKEEKTTGVKEEMISPTKVDTESEVPCIDKDVGIDRPGINQEDATGQTSDARGKVYCTCLCIQHGDTVMQSHR